MEADDHGIEMRPRTLITALITLAAIGCALLAFAFYRTTITNPYTQATLALSGSGSNGERLFRMNCAGCHGIAAQGLVGPDLHGVTARKRDAALIQQVVSGQTPPMPAFQIEPQAMADLLSYLHTLDGDARSLQHVS